MRASASRGERRDPTRSRLGFSLGVSAPGSHSALPVAGWGRNIVVEEPLVAAARSLRPANADARAGAVNEAMAGICEVWVRR